MDAAGNDEPTGGSADEPREALDRKAAPALARDDDMCLMLYIGTSTKVPPVSSNDLRVEELEASHTVRQWFIQTEAYFVAAHTRTCSCGFPSVLADTVIEHYEGMPLESDDRPADLRSVQALLDLLARLLDRSEAVELYPIAFDDQGKPPKGTVEWRLSELEPARFFFNEGFKHVVRTAATNR
jgi:hypothetical protein